jgi:acetyl esterase
MVAMDSSTGTSDSPTAGSLPTGRGTPDVTDKGPVSRPRTKAAKAPSTRKTAGSKATVDDARTPAPRSTRRSTVTSRSTRPPSPADATSAVPDGFERSRWRRSRSRALYDRRLQRSYEHWPLVTRVGAWLFSHPDLVLATLGTRNPVEVDGRVLNRSTQALLEVAKRFEASAGRGPDATAPYDPVAMRSQLTRMSRAAMPVRTDVHVTGRVLSGPGGSAGIPVRVYRQFGSGLGGGTRPPAIVYYHGGGWVAGDLDSHDASCRLLAAASGCIVVSVAYRLAPEDPYPAAVDDALAAYGWVQSHSDELGHVAGQVGVMGDSAGGNLAAVVALETRRGVGTDEPDVPPPVAQGLIYPALDARLDSDSVRSMADGFLLTRDSMEYFRRCYVPGGGWETVTVSPLLADDHRDLAPALVVTAGFDPLRDDGANYAEALRKSGVEVEYRCYDDQVHGFMGMGILPDSLALATEVCDAMGRLMRRSAPSGPVT